MTPPTSLSAAQVAHELGVDPEQGLSAAEAERRLARFGPNAVEVSSPPGFWKLLLRQFRSLLVLVLVVAAGLSAAVGDPQDALVILAVLILNAAIGGIQEARAERALWALREMSAPTARVLRDGSEQRIPAAHLVPGDVVSLRAGDVVPADGRLLSSASLQTDESALTGESIPVDKDPGLELDRETPLAERANMVFAGTAVTFGHGRVLITATGPATELGHLASAVQEGDVRATPLERQISWLSKVLSILALGASVIVFVLGLLRGQPLTEMFLVAVSLAVAAVPEGLPAVVTIVLALGVHRMARRNAVVRRLSSVEALGAATVICTDKTGTLTLGDMRVGALLVAGRRLEVVDGELREADRTRAAEADAAIAAVMRAAILCNNARLGAGDPTERALLYFARDRGVDRAALEAEWPRIDEIPFSSERKRMSTVHSADGLAVAFVKGAPDSVIGRCSRVMGPDGERELSSSTLVDLESDIEQLASDGLRLLALAERELSAPLGNGPIDERASEVERELTLLGVVGLLDPPRPEAPAALAAAKSAGIRTLMITGDHPTTARAIAQRLGIPDRSVMTGVDLERLDALGLAGAIATTSVYARVTPQQKVDIVQALQTQDEVVAMTGDGANDAPALRLADIGVAMGIRGTAVAREAAAMILTDDHYATIVAAVEEGRTIYLNLRRAVLYLLSGNLGEILVLLLAMLAGLPLPLQPVQILWINLLTDVLPGVGLGMEPPERGVMDRPPRKPGEPFLPAWSAPLIVVPSALLALVTLAAFAVQLSRQPSNLAAAQSAAFVTLVLAHLGIAWAQRATMSSSLALSARSNPMLLASFATGLGLLLLLLYTAPGQAFFHTWPLDAAAWALALVLTPVPFMGAEAAKAFISRPGR